MRRYDPARPWRKLYSTARWKRLRIAQLQAEPLCRFCKARGIIKPANTVDHIEPHRGDEELFWNPENLQSLDTICHNALKQQMESGGYSSMCDDDGMPLDFNHPQNVDARKRADRERRRAIINTSEDR